MTDRRAGYDLAANLPGAGARLSADRARAARPVATRLEALFGIHSPAQAWRKGVAGEVATAAELRRLTHPFWATLFGRPRRWFVLHAVPVGTRGSDIDHVLVGPPGVITVNSKHHRGKTVWAGDYAVTVNRCPTDHVRNSVYERDRTAALLSRAMGVDIVVTSAISVVAARAVTGRSRTRGILVRDVRALVPALRALPAVYDQAAVTRIYEMIRWSHVWTPPPGTRRWDA